MNDPRTWPWYGQVTAATAIIIGVCGAIVGMANAWSVSEPYMLAHRGFVRSENSNLKNEITSQIKSGDTKADDRLIRIERTLLSADLARSLENRKTIRTRIAQFQADLVKADMPESARRIIQEQLDRLIDDQLENDRRIEEIRRDLARQ